MMYKLRNLRKSAYTLALAGVLTLLSTCNTGCTYDRIPKDLRDVCQTAKEHARDERRSWDFNKGIEELENLSPTAALEYRRCYETEIKRSSKKKAL